ncbi:hypothetical protein RYX36_000086 [Vicia faba]
MGKRSDAQTYSPKCDLLLQVIHGGTRCFNSSSLIEINKTPLLFISYFIPNSRSPHLSSDSPSIMLRSHYVSDFSSNRSTFVNSKRHVHVSSISLQISSVVPLKSETLGFGQNQNYVTTAAYCSG